MGTGIDDSPKLLKELRRLVNLPRPYDHVGAGNPPLEGKGGDGALREYDAAERLMSDSA